MLRPVLAPNTVVSSGWCSQQPVAIVHALIVWNAIIIVATEEIFAKLLIGIYKQKIFYLRLATLATILNTTF